jgi:DNA-directed RNA polymerase beta subunit
MERAIKEKMSVYQEMVHGHAARPDQREAGDSPPCVNSSGRHSFRKFMDQANPLSEIPQATSVRSRPGRLSRERGIRMFATCTPRTMDAFVR